MVYNPDIHKRRSIRLKGYDYSSNGMYFITINTQDRANLFGEIIDREMVLNHAGNMIEKIWLVIPLYYKSIKVDVFQIMPNHFHGVLVIGQPQGGALTVSLSDAVHRFKSMTTKLYTDGVKTGIYPSYNKRVWQRNYYEHIIRNEKDYERIYEYIINNPAKWNEDEFLT